jgi:Tfp pilus assembly protein PilN
MIRINLLGVARPVARMAGPSEGVAPEAIILPGALLVVLLLITGFIYWFWTNQIEKLKVNLQQQNKEQTRLAGIKKDNERYKLQEQQLELRKETIRKLDDSKVGPQQLMTSLGTTLDRLRDLYLTSLTPKGDRLAMEGVANSMDAIADFIAALQNSKNFDDVQLKQSFQDNREKRVSFKFTLDCVYRQSAPESPIAPTAPPGRPAGAAARPAGL